MTKKPYGMICPITRACEILEPRWTIPILVALWAGNSKFNEIRREIGSISPALLSRRLKELEALGLVERVEDRASGAVDYIRTEAAIALEPVLEMLARWGLRFIKAELALCTANASSMMWKMRSMIDTDALPPRRVVIQFRFADEGLAYDTYWAVIQPGAKVEICTSIPGFEVDLYVETNVPSLLGIILGRTTIARETDLGELFMSGDALLARTMDRWLPVSEYTDVGEIEQIPDVRDWAAARRRYSVAAEAH
ncbi:transcriptional regulator [Rhodobacterales bacterium HKCCE3408]|nr:transcriptional regulator [Rhodobacterales bacterium HKCCE3408]